MAPSYQGRRPCPAGPGAAGEEPTGATAVVVVISGGIGGPADSTLLYTLYLYLRGFGDFQMGYASAMAWVFLVALGIITAIVFRSGSLWVHYADEGDR